MKSAALLLAITCVLAVPSASSAQNHKDKVKSTHMLSAKFVGFETGDYVHAILKDAKGNETTYYLNKPGLDFYLATFVNKSGTFKIEVVDSYIEEAGGRIEIDRIREATIGGKSYSRWWKEQRRKNTFEKLAKKYDPLVQKLTRTN